MEYKRIIEPCVISKQFSVIVKPLYDLLKKNAKFKFGVKENETLKNILLTKPILAIYSPHAET